MIDQPQPRRYLFYAEHNYCYDVLRPIQRVLVDRGDETAWLPVGDEFNREYLTPDEKCFSHVQEAIDWNPCAVMVPGNFVPKFIPGIKVFTNHGLISEKRRIRDGVIYHFMERGLFDLYIQQGRSSTTRWQEMAEERGYFEVVECGFPKLDPLFDGSLKKTPSDVPVVFFASTFSPRLTAAPVLVDTIKKLSEQKDWKWLVNFHPKMPADVIDRYRAIQNERLQVVEGNEVLPLLMDGDVMLCDTSSIISEFVLLKKPVVTFKNSDPKSFMIDIQNPGQLESALERALSRPPEIMTAIEQHIQETHPYTDGLSSQRAIDATDRMVESGISHLKPKPRNLVRHWKMRRKLHYYRFF